jgi:hypothetical protein
VTPTTGLPPEVQRYLDAVRATLADLAPEERDDLLGDVEASLVEAAGDEEGPLAARLGPPEEFAAELRASAGLAPAATTPATRPDPWSAAVRRAWTSSAVGAVRRLGRELAPIWWLARAYLAVAALATVGWVAWSDREPAIPRIGGEAWTVVVLLAAVAASVALGLVARRRGLGLRVAVLALDVLLLVAAVPVGRDVLSGANGAQPFPAPVFEVPGPPQGGLVLDGAPVQNIYPYDRDGKLLLDVQLFAESGQPIEVGRDTIDPQRRVPQDGLMTPLFNIFPIRYFEPASNVVADPGAGPRITPPVLATPPLAVPGSPSG